MNRSLSLLCASAALAVSASAQCFSTSGTSIVPLMTATGTFALDDEGLSSDILLPFAFPIGASTYNYVAVGSNGELYLTNGTGVTGLAVYGVNSMSELRGGIGGSPRIGAFAGDLQGISGLVGWDIQLDDTVAGEVKVSWNHMRFFVGTEDFSMSVTLYSSGDVKFDYSNGNFGIPNGTHWAFVSAGNDVGTGLETEIDLNGIGGGSSGSLALLYQSTFTPFDLNDQSILLPANGTGGYAWAVSCGTPPNPPSYHANYGTGCYDTSTFQAMYSYFANTTLSQAVANQSYTFVPSGPGYTWIPGGNAYVAPTGGATDLALTDDVEVNVTPSVPFNFLGTTPIPTLSVNSNGFVNMGPTGSNYVYAYGSVYELLNAAIPSFRSNADYNPGATGSGHVFKEEVGGVLYCTWNGVYRFGQTTPETMQIQLELATGVVTIVYGTMATTGNSMVIGYAPGGPSNDGGSLNIPADLPHTSTVDFSSQALALSASPNPISTAGSGTVVTYTVDNSPEVVPTSGLVAGLLIISLNQNPGLDLGFLGAPGCNLYVGSLDLTLSFVGAAGSQPIGFAVPPGVAAGTSLYVQAAALAPVNAFGIATSNGVHSFISDN